jgi:hypothetical protein
VLVGIPARGLEQINLMTDRFTDERNRQEAGHFLPSDGVQRKPNE